MWMLVAAVVAFAVWTGGVWWYSDSAARAECNEAALRSQVAQLQTQLNAARAAAKADAEVIEASREETERLEGAASELTDRISDGICFPEPDTRELRKLWGGITVRPVGGNSR